MKLNSGCLTGFWVSYIHTHRDEGVQIYIFILCIQYTEMYICVRYMRGIGVANILAQSHIAGNFEDMAPLVLLFAAFIILFSNWCLLMINCDIVDVQHLLHYI